LIKNYEDNGRFFFADSSSFFTYWQAEGGEAETNSEMLKNKVIIA
jgi:hypothetical protein